MKLRNGWIFEVFYYETDETHYIDGDSSVSIDLASLYCIFTAVGLFCKLVC